MNSLLHRNFRATIAAVFLCAAFFMVAASAPATEMTFQINALGANEVGAGDPDGFAIGTITFNNGTGAGMTGFATISLMLGNIDLSNLTGHHIHQAPAGVNGSIVLDLGNPNTILSGNMLSGTITNLSATTITSLFSNPTGFYYNLHNGAFPGGAVRGQIPEPSVSLLLLLGAGSGFLFTRLRKR